MSHKKKNNHNIQIVTVNRKIKKNAITMVKSTLGPIGKHDATTVNHKSKSNGLENAGPTDN